MEVSEVKKEIAELRDQLLDMLTKFEEKTGVQIYNVYISRMNVATTSEPNLDKIAEINLETIIKS